MIGIQLTPEFDDAAAPESLRHRLLGMQRWSPGKELRQEELIDKGLEL
jgi:hypothetical protein